MAKLGQYNLDEMTEQEVFEASATHLLEQSERSFSDDGDCAYKGEEGECCAAGIFVQNYSPEMEGVSWADAVRDYNQSNSHFDLVKTLQLVHDRVEPAGWLNEFIEITKSNSLDSLFLHGWSWSNEEVKYIKEN